MQETWVQFLCWEDPLRRKWLPTPVFLPGESHRWGSLVGCHLGGGTESVRHHSSDLAAAGLLSSGLAPLQLPKLSLLQTPAFWFVWAQLCIGPTNLGSTRPLLFLSPSLYSSPRMKASKLRDEVLEQRIATLFRKPEDWEDNEPVSQTPELEVRLFYTKSGRSECGWLSQTSWYCKDSRGGAIILCSCSTPLCLVIMFL